MWIKLTLPLLLCLAVFTLSADAQTRRQRVRPLRPVQESEEEASEEEQRPIVQFYRPEPKQDNAARVVYINDDEYNSLYGQNQQQTVTPKSRADTFRPATARASGTPSPQPRSKDSGTKAPVVQTIRNFNKVNDDGSFTFGYEAADGSFKEETRGTDCVVRGKYGYVDPEGNRREFTYVSGNPCDPNNPDGEDEETKSQEDSDENVPQNYPQRPAVQRPRPTSARPTQSPTTRAPTTVFQNRYNHQSLPQEESSEEDEAPLQYAQIPSTTARPSYITQRPQVQIINTTPKSSINITPKPLYRIQNNHLAGTAAPPATTYRPQTISYATQRPTSASPSYAPAHQSTKPQSYASSTRGPIDFDAEFKKFQQTHNYVSPSTPSPHAPQSNKHQGQVTNNPVYQSQLVFNPSTGQYDSSLYQSIAHSDQEFDLNLRHQPYVQQYQIPQTPPQHLVTYEQAAQNQQFRHLGSPPPPPQSQVPQQIYQKQQNDLQFVNSQQLFAQQLELQQTQLQRDRLEASKKQHRFQLPSPQPQALRAQPPPQQQLYYFQPQQGGPHGAGQIDAFLRNHNIEY